MRKYLDFFLVLAIFEVLILGALAVSGSIDYTFGSLGVSPS